MPGKKQTEYKTRPIERTSYGLYFLGQNIFYFLFYLFFATFMTDIGITAAMASVITIIVKVWDAVNDPIFGGIVDRVRFKKGKFLPWLRISLVLIPLSTVLFFATPAAASTTVKVVWVTVAYMLWDTAYTICDVPIFGLVTTLTDNLNERTSLMAIGRVCAGIAAAVLVVTLPQIRVSIGGWFPSAVLFSVIAVLVMIPICFTAKERIEPVGGEQETGLKEMFRYLGKNKYLLIFYAALIIYSITNVWQTLSMYFARHLLGDEGLMTLFAALVLGPSLVLTTLLPALIKRVDKFYLYFWSVVAVVVLSVVAYFVGYNNFTALVVMTLIKSIPAGMLGGLMFMFTPDCVEYGHYKTGINAPGITFSIQTFTAKMTAALSTSVGLAALALIGFVEGEGAVQPAGFNDNLWIIYTLLPIVGALISIPILTRYKLRDKDVQIMARSNAGEISRAEAEKLLGGRYD